LSQRQELSLVQVLRQTVTDTIITSRGICPECEHHLSEEEIRAGWNTDPQDYTTQCPQCEHRFQAHLFLSRQGKIIGEQPYLCLQQLFAGLQAARRGKRQILGEVYLSENHPMLFWNMIRHFATYNKGLLALARYEQGILI